MCTEIDKFFAKEGGPAFPHPGGSSDSEVQYSYLGMTLRDYFAAKAMQTELITCGVPGAAWEALQEVADDLGRTPLEHVACNSYEIADAMLKARNTQGATE